MQSFDIIRESPVKETFRVKSIMNRFDLNKKHSIERFSGNLDLPEEWSIGVIYGSSGSGKSTIAKELFKDAYIDKLTYGDESIIDEMPKDKKIDEIVNAFISVGFSTPPNWIKPYSVLSMGEKMRVDLARVLLSEKDLIVFDEFTSVVDRQIAKIASIALSKSIRDNKKQFIAVSCHEDIIDHLEPDWVFNTNEMKLSFVKKKDQKLKGLYIKSTQIYGPPLESFTI